MALRARTRPELDSTNLDEDKVVSGLVYESGQGSLTLTFQDVPLSTTSTARHPRFFMDEGVVFLRVSPLCSPHPDFITRSRNQVADPVTEHDCLFKVHRYFLERDSEFFRDMFSCPLGGASVEGETEESAIALPGVTRFELECLLSFLYNGMYERDVSIDEWVAILSISSRFLFDRIRERAIREIATYAPPLDPVERIFLATKHDIPQWLRPAYMDLCIRPESLTEEEAQKLGLPTVVRLARAREQLSQGRRETRRETFDDYSVDALTGTKQTTLQPQPHHSQYALEHIFQITSGFSITMAQSRRNNIDLRPSSTTNTLNQPGTEMVLTINPGHDSASQPLSLITRDSQGLKLVLEAYRRLRKISVELTPLIFEATQQARYEAAVIYKWLAPYLAEPSRIPMLSSIPPDIRILKKPLHTLLSAASAGIPGDETSDIALVREDWIRSKIKHDLIPNCPGTSSLRIRIGTYNVNGQLPSQDLSPWVGGRLDDSEPLQKEHLTTKNSIENNSDSISLASTLVETSSHSKSPDIISSDLSDSDLLVFAFQELDLSTEALLYSTKTVREDAWCAALFAGLGEKASLYEKLTSKQLVGMLLVAIVKKELKSCFVDIKSASGNKGATALRLTYVPPLSSKVHSPKPTVLTFVNSHLAAFDEMYERRNADFHDLSKRLMFDSGIPAPSIQSEDGLDAPILPLNIYETDALFWMVGETLCVALFVSHRASSSRVLKGGADLNYRINLPDIDIRQLLRSQSESRDLDWKILLGYDQLRLAMRTNKAFELFSEHPITHPPSYRFSAGITPDDQGYDTKRKPGWTDRILYLHSAMVELKQFKYSSHPEITMSDHRPVSADFRMTTPLLNRVAYNSFIEDTWKLVASMEDEDVTPKVRLSDSIVDLGQISYRQRATKTLDLENIGQVPCIYRFIGANTEQIPHPEWLTIDKMTGLILPGQRTTLALSTELDNNVTSRLNRGTTNLEFTLVLHIAYSKDHFITVIGKYERTCFANDVTWLTRLPGPIKSLRSLSELLPEEHMMSAPREIMLLIKWIMSNATEVEGIFLKPGDEELLHSIRECLDVGTEFDILRHTNDNERLALAVADTLLRFLASLPEPIFPTPLHQRCVEITSKEEAFELLNELPSVSLNVWISVTAVLHYITQQSPSKRHTEQLVAVFASVLLRETDVPISILGKRNFVRYFIA
ncbi:uncharacterized protein FIBRA_01385 [Fibroporia radiculosa]|uniref:Rho-GAP domain-containing protein n=1 Tax=Fibroporia radiculosa TaxID=599839 RepID=J4HT89_9APHY|nr:uncharacterized protein FIBRA_01385 [Fibroporia radiculosa]CCL99367.1 predicted protein [Fibroporia radiculosa]